MTHRGRCPSRVASVSVLAVLLIMASCKDGTGPNGSLIAFYSARDGSLDVFTMNKDGGEVRNLTIGDTTSNATPAWSADGKWIVFTTGRAGRAIIEVMRSDGASRHAITSDTAFNEYPSWSPDGMIVFTSYRDGNGEIYIMNADGSSPTRLTTNDSLDLHAVVSPQGTKIAFTSTRDGHPQIYVMNANGSEQTNLSNDTTTSSTPIWSPDGTRIAFSRQLAPGAQGVAPEIEVYVMNANGTGVTRLTTSAGVDYLPSWSPDGRRIVFASTRDGINETDYRIYVMNVDGSDQRPLTTEPGFDTWPRWRP